MTSRFMFAVAVLVVFSAIWCGCGRLDANTVLTKIPGTEGVDVWHPSLSISPDGEYMIILTDSDRYENNGHRFDFQIATLNISTGEVRQHRPANNIDKSVLERILKRRTTIGFYSAFEEDSWCDGKFYIRVEKCLEIDPCIDEYFDISKICPPELRSSDRVERKFLFDVEKKFKENGAFKDATLIRILYGDAREQGYFTMPSSVDRSMPVLYYVGAKTGNVVYRSDGKANERVHRYGGLFYTRGITQIKASPDGRYLAMVRQKRIGSPVPIPGGGFDLTILDLERDKKFVLKTSRIGSCVWTPDSKTLYVACSDDGDGVYQLEISDAFH